MTIDISTGVLVTMVGALFTTVGKVIWAVGAQVIISLKSGDASRVTMVETQGKILEMFKGYAEQVTAAKALDRLRRGLARSNPSLMFCDVCKGWEGPEDLAPSGTRNCICSDPPPKA